MAKKDDFTLGDIQEAVKKVTDGHLTGAQQDAVVQAIWTETKKGAAGKAPADVFETTVTGFISNTKTVKTLVGQLPVALSTARNTRLASKSSPDDAAEEKKTALKKAVEETWQLRTKAQELDQGVDNRLRGADKSAKNAEKVATRVEEIRPGTTEATDARTIATRVRKAHSDAAAIKPSITTQVDGAHAAWQLAKATADSDGTLNDAEAAVKDGNDSVVAINLLIEQVNRLLGPIEQDMQEINSLLNDAETEKKRKEDETEKKRKEDEEKKKKEEAEAEQAKAKSFKESYVMPRVPGLVIVAVALLFYVVALFMGLPWILPGIGVLAIISAAVVVATPLHPRVGQWLAGAALLLTLLFVGIAYFTGNVGGGNNGGNDGGPRAVTDGFVPATQPGQEVAQSGGMPTAAVVMITVLVIAAIAGGAIWWFRHRLSSTTP